MKSDKARKLTTFLMIGLLNTAIDFLILFSLVELGIAIIFANIVSTSIALLFSFYANRRFTFRAENEGPIQGLKFFTVSIAGLWVLQPMVMTPLLKWLEEIPELPFDLFIAKCVATAASLVWNYVLYQKLVFRQQRETI